MFKNQPILTTEHITLRPIVEDDARDIFDYFKEERVMKYYDLAPFKKVDEATSLIINWIHRRAQNKGCRWAIVLNKHAETVIGTCGFHNFSEENNRIEIGYEIAPAHWGKGYATSACKLVINYGLLELKFRRIEAYVDPQHFASKNVLMKCGMESEGVLRDYFFEKGRFVDAEIFSILNK